MTGTVKGRAPVSGDIEAVRFIRLCGVVVVARGDDTVRYYFGTRVASSWQLGRTDLLRLPGRSIAADGEVLEIEPGRRVARSFHPRWSPELEADGPVRITWAIQPADQPGAPTRLVVTTAIVPRIAYRGGVHQRHRAHRFEPQDPCSRRVTRRGLRETWSGSVGGRCIECTFAPPIVAGPAIQRRSVALDARIGQISPVQ